uniref:carboxylesterase/lipase family protein n=1 Tax=uncultured Sphingomonas sp. TaxID=158754 RepID=UPI0035CC64C9
MSLTLALLLSAAGPVVTTDDGPVRGQSVDRGAIFRGIRFATAQRWGAPHRPPRWSEPVDTIAEHAACPQPDYGAWNRAASRSGSEDCLFVDVRTPNLSPKAKLPVLVWIHGGGNRGGAGGGTVENRLPGVVLVSIQYRLGALGFMSHTALSAENGGSSGNYGLLDQQSALRWVRRNIAAFGGDPARVTIAGESAGAQDVALHQLSPGSRGLFAQAIQESGTAGFGVSSRSLAQNEAVGALIAAKAGLPADATAAQLRALPVDRLLAAQEAVDVPDLDDDSFIWLQAVVDGRVLTDTPAHLLASGRFSRVPLIVGVNAKELTLHGGLAAAPGIVRREFGAHADAALRFYGLRPGETAASDPRLGDVTLQLADDLTFRCPTQVTARAVASHDGSTWQYQYDYVAPGGAAVTHGSEIRSVFGTPATGLEAGAPPLQAYWLNFVRAGNPNGTGLPTWPRYSAAAEGYIDFAQDGPIARSGLRRLPCAWRSAP